MVKDNIDISNDYFLVTTANAKSWDASRKILFLGEWCHDYSKRNEIAKLDYSIATPICVSGNEKRESIDFVVRKTKDLLSYAREILNKYHSTSHQLRYWNIVLGHWLRRYVSVIYNRYYSLQKAIQNYHITETASVSYKSYSLVTQSSLEFLSKADNDDWNIVLYDMLLKLICPSNISPSKSINLKIKDIEFTREKKKKGFKWLIKYVMHSSLKYLTRDTDSLIIETYMGRLNEVFLKLSLLEAPTFEMGDYDVHPMFSIDENSRGELTPIIDSPACFDDVLKIMLMKVLPTCFLEGYKDYLVKADQSDWPKNPKFIFTSNAFDTNDVFKLYAAELSEIGVPYFVGQHGNAYGTHIDSFGWPELDAVDKFFSWGWGRNGSKKIVPTFAFNKYMSGKKIKRDKNGMMLLVENALPPLYEPYDTTYEYGLYQSEQFGFIRSLESNIHEHVLVRLFAHHIYLSWHEKLRWRDELPDILLDDGCSPFMSLVKRSRIVIFSFDTTGILELLAMNFPLLCFWRGGTSHVHDTEKHYYDLLIEVGVFHNNPESAARKVNEIWDDIDDWWGQDKVQKARKQFCERYAKVSKNQVRELKHVLLQQISELV